MVLFVRKRAAITIWNIKAVVTLILVSLFTWLHLLRKALGTSLGLAVTLQQPLLSLEQTTGFLTTSADLYALDSRKSEGKKDLAHTKLHGLLAPPERAAHPLASERDEWSSGYPCPQNLVRVSNGKEKQVWLEALGFNPSKNKNKLNSPFPCFLFSPFIYPSPLYNQP